MQKPLEDVVFLVDLDLLFFVGFSDLGEVELEWITNKQTRLFASCFELLLL